MPSLPHFIYPFRSVRPARAILAGILLLWLGLSTRPANAQTQAPDLSGQLRQLYEDRYKLPASAADLLYPQWLAAKPTTEEETRSILIDGGYYLYQFFQLHERFDQLIPVCESVLSRLRPGHEIFHTEYRTWQGRIAEATSTLGKKEEARALWHQLVDSLLVDPSVDSLFVGEVYLQLTKLAYQNGWFQQGLEYGAAGIRYLDRFDDTNMFSSLLLSIGRIYNSQGEYVQAITHFRRAIDILETIPASEVDPASLTIPYVEVAMAYGNQGKEGLCREFYEKAVKVMSFPTVAYYDQITILGNLAGQYREVNDSISLACIDRALELYGVAKQAGETVSETSRRVLMVRKGRLFYLLGEWDASFQVLRSVLDEAVRAEDFFPALFAANVLVTRSLALDQPQEALEWWQAGYRILRQDYSLSSEGWESSPETEGIGASQNLARFFLYRARAFLDLPEGGPVAEQQKLTQARQAAMAAQNFLLEVRRGQHERDQEFNQIFQECQGIRLEILARMQGESLAEEMFRLMDRSKVISLQEDWLMERRKNQRSVPDSILRRLEQLEREVVELEAAIFDDELDAPYDSAAFIRAYENKSVLVEKSRALHELESVMSGTWPEFALSDNQYPFVPVDQVRSLLLGPRSAVLTYFYSSRRLFAALLTRDSVHVVGIPVDESLLQALDRVIEGCRSPDAGRRPEWPVLSHRLYQLILEPVMAYMPDAVSELMIVPDGPLVELPFEAMVLNPDSQPRPEYLLDRFSISYWLSVRSRLLLEEAPQDVSTGHLASFAPEYPKAGPELAMLMDRDSVVSRLVREGEFDLPGASQEATLIADMWDGQVYKGTGVSEQEFLDEASRFSVLHLAMHALLEKDQEQFSRLLFAPSEGEGRGFLSAMEIAEMDLPAEMVVLSACNTGRGTWRAGEGVYHLGRAFRMAGVRSLVLSLWQVPDQATSELMPAFYQALKEGDSKSEALRSAKLAYLDAADPAMQAPYYWAGFILIGDQAPVELPESHAWWWIPALLLVVAAGVGIWIRIRQKQGIHEDNRSDL